MLCILCIVHCVLCIVYCLIAYCVLCILDLYLFCIVYCVLCIVYCVLCIVYCVLCIVCSAHCAISHSSQGFATAVGEFCTAEPSQSLPVLFHVAATFVSVGRLCDRSSHLFSLCEALVTKRIMVGILKVK
jgi:hypothetical protein